MNSNNVCPCCGRHCSAENLHCPRGMAHFGIETNDVPDEHRRHFHGSDNIENMTQNDRIIELIRGCGHYLHHSAGADSSETLLSALTDDEKASLAELLKKCLTAWKN